MSSSTKMNGPGILWTSHSRPSTEATTIPVSQAASGIRAARSRSELPTELELGEPPGDLRCLGAPRRHADGCRGLAHLAQHGGADGPAARDAFERRGLELRDPVE